MNPSEFAKRNGGCNGCVFVENYEVTACHGVNPEEKIDAQRFLISAWLDCDVTRAAETDDIDQTISYSAVCKRIKAFFLQESRNLLEYLATGTARMLAKEFPLAERVTVTVRKPDAPMKGVFDAVGVTVAVRRSVAYVALGSSMGDRAAYLDRALELLSADELVLSVRESTRIVTPPYGGVAQGEFLNSVAEVVTLHTPESLLVLLQEIERSCGRERLKRWDDRTLDLDILFFGEEVRGSGRLTLPHPDMENRLFVLQPLAELAPAFIHPLTGRRVSEMLRALKDGR